MKSKIIVFFGGFLLSSAPFSLLRASLFRSIYCEEHEEKRVEFMSSICSERTRPDARAWIEKVFNMDQANQAAAAMREAKDKRRRRIRSSSVASESGLSGQTGYTGVTGTELI